MDNLVESLKSINFYSGSFWIAAGILLVGSLVLGLFARFVFGQKSILNVSVSSAFDILFIYGLTVILSSSGLQLSKFVVPLPFVSIASDSLLLLDFLGAHYTILCSQLLSMIILAFLVNLVDCIFPKKIAAAGMAAHLAGAIAANSTLPVIGIPCKSSVLDGMDALLATVQMPTGIPVATVAINGGANAALLAAQILAVSDEQLASKLDAKRVNDARAVLEKDAGVMDRL